MARQGLKNFGSEEERSLKKRVLPKLVACITKQSLENMRNKVLFAVDSLDAKEIRRRKLPLHECLILELKETGFTESAYYIQDLLYDNAQLCAEDEIGIVVDLTKKPEYLEHICLKLQQAETEREKGNTEKEAMVFLNMAKLYADKGKGILWLAEKFFLVSIAVASQYILDGGRLHAVCKFFYAKFLLDKFPGADTDEAFNILTEVRDSSIGKSWPLYENMKKENIQKKDTVFGNSAIQLHRVLLANCRRIRKSDPTKAERLARLAERRGVDADDLPRVAESIIEMGICQLMMNNLNNAKKTLERALKINTDIDYIDGICVARMHLAAVMQRLGDHEYAAQLLTDMGALAMKHGLRLQLGRALHLLGELHLRRECPELGTMHLQEAFACFLGSSYVPGLQDDHLPQTPISTAGVLYDAETEVVYMEEADQSRIVTAISAAQEVMESYFNLIRDADACTVATVKCIMWKLCKQPWWVDYSEKDLPCMCPVHNRTPLEIMWRKLGFSKTGKSLDQKSSEKWKKGTTKRENQSAFDLTKHSDQSYEEAEELPIEENSPEREGPAGEEGRKEEESPKN